MPALRQIGVRLFKMQSFIILFLLAAACTATELKSEVTLYLSFESQPPEIVVEEMKSETREVLQPVGVDLGWRSFDDPRSSEPVAELVVVKFERLCEAIPDARVAEGFGALGWTQVSDGDVLPFSDVDCSRTWGLIRNELVGVDRTEQDRILGRALGRVLAHELYHVFANTIKHTSIAKSCYTAPELVGEAFHFQKKAVTRLQQGKLRRLLQLKRSLIFDSRGVGQ